MKAIVGVDADGLYQGALDLLGRLRLPDPSVLLLHAGEPILPFPDAGFLETPEMATAIRNSAESLLNQADQYATGRGLAAHHEFCIGPVTSLLLEATEDGHADLIAIGSHQKSKYGALVLGSTGRGLTISSKCSVLIAKGPVATEGTITAVLATDYSDYSQSTIRQLADMRPAGLAKVTLLTAVASLEAPEPTVLQIVERVDAERRYIDEASGRMAALLESVGIAAEVRFAAGDVHESIEAAMRDSNAELLIMGAHGHGFFERLVLGSTSLREALTTHHPIWILRRPVG